MRRHPAIALALTLALAACAQGGSGSDGYPALLPFEDLVDASAPPPADPAASVAARGAALRARAAALLRAAP